MADTEYTATTDIYGSSFGLVREGQSFTVDQSEGDQLVKLGHATKGGGGTERPAERPYGEPVPRTDPRVQPAPMTTDNSGIKAEPAPLNKAEPAPKSKRKE